jgi:hypothetical protein
MSTPRHRLDPAVPPATRLQPPPIVLRSIDFDAVAPYRRPDRTSGSRQTDRQASATTTSDALYLAHS